MIEADPETDEADDPAGGAHGRTARTMVGEHCGGDETQEPDVQGPHDLARQAAAELHHEPVGDGDGGDGQGTVEDGAPSETLQDEPCRPDDERRSDEVDEGQSRPERPVEGNAEGGDDLDDGERDRRPEQEPPEQALAEALGEAVFRIGDRLGGRLHALKLMILHGALPSDAHFLLLVLASHEEKPGRDRPGFRRRLARPQEPCFLTPFSARYFSAPGCSGTGMPSRAFSSLMSFAAEWAATRSGRLS